MIKTKVYSEKGISLIETLASIVLLSILVVSLLTMFVQSAKTNKASEKIIDATYVAQNTIESIYNVSRSSTSFDGTVVATCRPRCHFQQNEAGFDIKITIENKDLYKVLVEVFNSSTGRKEAQMETLLTWKQ